MGRASLPHLSNVTDTPGSRWPFSVSVVIAALNEGATISGVVERIRIHCPGAEVLVIDDCSTDDTAARAEAAGARVIRRPYTLGQGAGVKTGVRAASGEIVVLIDGDGQHDPADIPRLLDLIGPYDLVIGERDRAGQQNAVRWLGNSALNRIGSYLVGLPMRDLTSGFRAMRRHVMLDLLHLLPNQFSWSTTSALAFAKMGFHVRFEPIVVRRRETGQSSQKLMRNGIRFLLIILRMSVLFSPLRIFFPLFILLELLALAAYGGRSRRADACCTCRPPPSCSFSVGWSCSSSDSFRSRWRACASGRRRAG